MTYLNVADCYLQKDISDCFEAEVLGMAQRGTYVGIWTFHVAASVLGRSIHSWFPNVSIPGFAADRHALNRIVEPLEPSSKRGFAILWTKAYQNAWSYNHFVPVVM